MPEAIRGTFEVVGRSCLIDWKCKVKGEICGFRGEIEKRDYFCCFFVFMKLM